MKREPKVYIALENEAGRLVVHGPLELLDRLVATLEGQGVSRRRAPILAGEREPRMAVETGPKVEARRA